MDQPRRLKVDLSLDSGAISLRCDLPWSLGALVLRAIFELLFRIVVVTCLVEYVPQCH